jgi:GINS complex subunit 4
MTNPEVQQRLSESEVEHARRYVVSLAGSSMEFNHVFRFARLTDQHFYHSVLQSLPETQQTLDDRPPFVPSMGTEFSISSRKVVLTKASSY